MREIMFRGKSLDDNKWVYGGFAQIPPPPQCCGKPPPPKNVIICEKPGTMADWGMPRQMCMIEVDPKTVGQCTGINASDGTQIFEGDYVSCRKYLGGNWAGYSCDRGYVEFMHGAFGLHKAQGYYRPFKDWLEDYELEVIGNIHDNPPKDEK